MKSNGCSHCNVYETVVDITAPTLQDGVSLHGNDNIDQKFSKSKFQLLFLTFEQFLSSN